MTPAQRVATAWTRQAGLEYVGPEPYTEGPNHGVAFSVSVPNPKHDPSQTYIVRGKPVYGDGGPPRTDVAYLLAFQDRDRAYVGQVTTNPKYRNQGISTTLHDMAYAWAKSKGLRFESGWVQSKVVDRYWRRLEAQGKAEGHDDPYNVGGRGWVRIAAPTSPRQELTPGFKFRVTDVPGGLLVRVYRGTSMMGGVLAYWTAHGTECQKDEDALREQHSELAQAPVLYVWKADLREEAQGLGVGRAMYQAMMAEGYKKKGPFLFTNTRCYLGSGTSKAAQRVWVSLARQYPSSGDMVAVLRPPVINSRDLDGVQKAAGGAKYLKKKEVPKATGKGTTTVYEYSEQHIKKRHKEKAERYEGLSKDIDKLRKQVLKDIDAEDPKTRLTALAIGLIDATFERVGNDGSADDGHFGVTGWLKKHVTFGKGKATIRYVGKSGVDHEKVVDDKKLVKALKDCCGDKKPGDTLLSFGKDDAEGAVRVTSRDVNAYLEPFDVTAKDLRGFHANREMQDALRAERKKGGTLPEDKKEREKKLKEEFKAALEATAEAVGHEASTLRTQYLVPSMEDTYMKDGTVLDKLKGASAARVASAWMLRASRWAYHGTMQDRLPWIHQYGLVPDAAPRLRRDDESGLFFSDTEGNSRNYGGSEVLLRFPYPEDGIPDTHPVSGRVIPHAFITRKTVPPSRIEIEMDGAWQPLSRARIATKSESEKEDEEVRRLSRPPPKLKPPRDDSKRERIDTSPDEEKDKDLSLNYKDVGG